MARRVAILLAIVALGAVAFVASRNDQPAEEEAGLVVHVHVVDQDGKPVKGAQVRRRFTQDPWATVDGAGDITLRSVPLNAGKEPSASSLAAAILVRARFLGVRSDPAVKQVGHAWDATFTLAPHGVIRLSIAPTHLAPIKAWIEPDPEGRLEAMGGHNVARLDKPVAFRVQPGLEELVVRVQGEADPAGTIRAANQRLVFKAPRPGVVSQAVVRAEPAQPINGAVHAANEDGSSAILVEAGAEVVVHMLEDEKPTHELGRVSAKKGHFLIPFTGRGPYALTLHAPLRAPGPMKVAGGNTQVMVFMGRRLPWIKLTHRELDPKRRPLTLVIEDTDGKPTRVAHTVQRERTWTRLVFQEQPGPVTVRAEVPGTNKERPLQGTSTIDVHNPGEEGTLQLEPAPSGQVVFGMPATESLGSLALGVRKTTLVPGSSKPATLRHVRARAGIPLAVTWRKTETGAPDQALIVTTIDVVAGETATVDIPSVAGGFVRWDGPRERELLLRWQAGETPYGDARGTAVLVWNDDHWLSAQALLPGMYRAGIGDQQVRFSIEAGETTVATRTP